MSDDKAKVVFNTEAGQRVETWVVVGTLVGNGPTRISYLRRDPTVARLGE